MPPKKKPVSMLARLHQVAWSTRLRKSITLALGIVGLLAGTITKVAEAWPRVEPFLWVSQGYYRDDRDHIERKRQHEITQLKSQMTVAQDDTRKKFLDIQLDIANQAQRTTQAEVYRLQDKVNDETDPQKKQLYRERWHEYQSSLDALNKQIDTLTKQRGQ